MTIGLIIIPAVVLFIVGLWLLFIALKDFIKATIYSILGTILIIAGLVIIISQFYQL